MNRPFRIFKVPLLLFTLLTTGFTGRMLLAQSLGQVAQADSASPPKSWEAVFLGGNVPIDQDSRLRLSVLGDVVRAETKYGEALVIPVRSLAKSQFEQSKLCRGCSLLNAGSGSAGTMAGGLIIGGIVSLIPKADVELVDLVWEEGGIRTGIALRFRKGEGAAFSDEIKRLRQESRPRPEAESSDAVHASAPGENQSSEPAQGANPSNPGGELHLTKMMKPLEPVLPESTTFELKQVYSGNKGGPGYLDWEGKLIYYSTGPSVEVVDWQLNRTVLTKKFQDLPCRQVMSTFDRWQFFPGRSEILVRHCGSLYLLDGSTLEIKRLLLRGGTGLYRERGTKTDAILSSKGEWLACQIDNALEKQIVIFDTATWKVHARIPVSTDSAYMHEYATFNSDGTAIVVGHKSYQSDMVLFETYQVATGAIHSRFWLKQGYYMGGPVPGQNGLIAAVCYRCYGEPYHTALVDIESGKTLQKLPSLGSTYASDWRWSIGAGKVEDPISGRALATLPKIKGSFQESVAKGDFLITNNGVLYQLVEKK